MVIVDQAAAPRAEELDTRCPLCEYDLRGTAEPRCPECGYRFTWEELRDPKLRLHRYLFEHHPERNVSSFRQTILGSVRPRWFWKTVYPTQPSNLKRLVLYWAICAAVASVFLVLVGAAAWMTIVSQNTSSRKIILASYGKSLSARLEYGRRKGMTVQQYFDQFLPLPPSPGFFKQLAQPILTAGIPLVLLLAWPWLAMLSLMIFRASMRKAKVKTQHVLRCVIYSSDLVVWCSIALWWIPIVLIGQAARSWTISPELEMRMFYSIWIAVGLMALVFPYRLIVAYRRYLRFDHAIATILLVQIVVILAQAVTLLNLMWYLNA